MTINNYRNLSVKRISFLLTLLLLLGSISLYAQPRSDYYSSIDGLKKEALKQALGNIVKNHTKRSYDQLKTDYKSVYVVPGTQEQVWDIFSDEQYNYSSGGWNREHVVPNSWWGGVQNNAYSDLFSVIPSDATANSQKSNYPPAELTNNVKYDSGRIKVGTPKSGLGGSYNLAFEPYDEFKGDFARIYFYIATCYDNIDWDNNSNSPSEIKKNTWPTLQPWLYKMLIRWNNLDPVSDMEKQINNAVEDIQGNRNPFIDYPVLADYIWNEDYFDSNFSLSAATLYTHIDGESGSGDDSGEGDDGGDDDDDEPVYTGTATYTIDSSTSVTTAGRVPNGSSATFSNTYTNNKQQLTKGSAMELDLSGYDGKIITGITLSMKSNTSSGAGFLTVKASNTVLAAIGTTSGVKFNDAAWNGAWSTKFVDVTLSMTDPDYIIKENQKVSIKINATDNSLYCESFTIQWKDADYSEPTIECEPTLDIASTECDGTFGVTWTNAENIGVNLYADADCQTPFTEGWLLVDLNDDNNVYYLADANSSTTESRTVYMQLYASDGSSNTISKVVTVTQAPADKVNLILTWTNSDTPTMSYVEEGGSVALTETNLKSVEITEDIEGVSVSYTRSFGNTNWQAWYMPFEIDPADLPEGFQAAYINDNHIINGNIEIEIIALEEGQIMKANHPYLVKAPAEGSYEIKTTSTLYQTKENTIDCSSTTNMFYFNGTYQVTSMANVVGKPYGLSGGKFTSLEGYDSKPYRFYMNIVPRDGSQYITLPNEIKLVNVFGEDLDDADAISEIKSESVREGAYDLMGRKATSLVKGNIYIINGKKTYIR